METTSQSNSGPYRATKLWNEALRAFRDNMPIGRHRRNMRTFENCFVASDAVDWLNEYLKRNSNFGPGVSRYQTVQLLQKFHKGQIFIDVRGSKHKEQFQDNGRLYRFIPMSPVKNGRTPLKKKRSVNNLTPVPRPLKLDFAQHVKPVDCAPEKELPRCQLVAKQLTQEEMEKVYKTATLARLRRVLGVRSLEEIVEMPNIQGCNAMHNLVHLNKSGVVSNIKKEEQLPHYILSAMRCLAYWPGKVEENLPKYPGFERDVFRVVQEHFESLDEPLLTYDLYELFVNIFVHVENPDPRRPAPRGNSTYGFSPMSQDSFVSVENLVLSMASPAPPEYRWSQWNVSQINNSMEYIPPPPYPKHLTSSQPNLLDITIVDENQPNLKNRSFYDNFGFETNDSDQSGKLQRHYSYNNLDDAENYLENISMRTRKPSATSINSSRSGLSTLSTRSFRSAVSSKSGFSTATMSTESGYSCVKLARAPNVPVDCTEDDRSLSYPHRVKCRQPPPEYRDPPPYNSVHRTASISSFRSNCSELETTPAAKYGARPCVRRRRICSVYSALWEHSSSIFSDSHETKLINALQICSLLLPPANRRKAHLLLRLMNKMVNNPDLSLDDELPLRTKVLQTFYQCIIMSAVDDEFDEQTSLCLVAFLMDHYEKIFIVPQDLKEHIENRLAEMQRAQVKYVEDPLMVTFCEQVTNAEYENETLTNSELALADLLDSIVQNEKMAQKEKKKRLKQFQKEYPKIYRRRFPNPDSENEVLPSRSKSRTPLLSGAMSKLKAMRL